MRNPYKTDLKRDLLKEETEAQPEHTREWDPTQSALHSKDREWGGQEGVLGEYLEGKMQYRYGQESREQWLSPWVGEVEQNSGGCNAQEAGAVLGKTSHQGPTPQRSVTASLRWTLSPPELAAQTETANSRTASPLPTCAQTNSLQNSRKASAKKGELCSEQIVELTPKETVILQEGCKAMLHLKEDQVDAVIMKILYVVLKQNKLWFKVCNNWMMFLLVLIDTWGDF